MNSVATSETENEVPTVPAKPTANEVYTLLVDTLLPQWYDLFLHLGIDRAILDKSFSDHPFDPHVCLLDMIKLWLQREDPPATWKEMADVLRCKLLEGRYAVIVEEKYCSDPSHPPHDETKHSSETTEADDIAAQLDDDSIEFSKILLDITELLGQESFPDLYHYLVQLRCPDGTPIIDVNSLHDRRSPDGLMTPLVYMNLCTSRDVDLLIHLLHGLKREDLLPMIQEYIPKIGMGVPYVRAVYDENRFFAVKAFLNPAIKHVDLGIVSVVKHSLCVSFGLESKPYIIQFIGWKADPISLHFQVPIPCMYLVQEGIASCTHNFASCGIEKLELGIHGAAIECDLTT